MTPTPVLGQIPDHVVDFLPRADVDPARWFVEDQDLGVGPQPAGDHRLLLVSAGEARDPGRAASAS